MDRQRTELFRGVIAENQETPVKKLFTKRTGWGHNLSQLGYYDYEVTIAIKYNGDIMGKTALRLVSNTKYECTDVGNSPAIVDAFEIGHGFHYWDGATGTRYLHSVYGLMECPELPKANYIIVRRLECGERVPLHIGQTKADASSLNLAHIRQTAARLGASEIHIHVLTDSPTERSEVERDLLKGQFKRIESRLRAQAANGFYHEEQQQAGI